GEITKSDENLILSQEIEFSQDIFSKEGHLIAPPELGKPSDAATKLYTERYLNVFAPGVFDGLKIGVYQHSAVGRDLLVEIYSALGATVVPLGRSESFVPVDTEAIR